MGVREGARGLTGVIRTPAGRPRDYVTPSGAATLLECKLRVAFASERLGGPSLGSPATRLGSICHKVLENTAKGALGPPEEARWAEEFERAWRAAVAEQEDALARLNLARPWPPPEKWPFFAQRKVATKRIARELGREVHAPGFVGSAEDDEVTADGRIRGKPDLIVRAPVHEVRDYKTGAVNNPDGSVREGYALQVQLYAVLEQGTVGDWPQRGVLVPIPGTPEVVDVQPGLAQRAAGRAVEALDAYNSAVESGEIVSLGSASPQSCRYCEFAPGCGAFWEGWTVEWEEAGLAATIGTVEEVRSALRGGVSVDISAEAGISENGRLAVHDIDPFAIPVVSELRPGDPVAIVGLRVTSPGHAVSTYRTRLATEVRRPTASN